MKDAVKTFSEERDWDQFHNAKDLAIGIITESSELLELFRFKDSEEIEQLVNSIKRKQVAEELSDVLFFVLRFAQKYDIDLSKEFLEKIEKNKKKYPIKKIIIKLMLLKLLELMGKPKVFLKEDILRGNQL